MIDKLWRWEIIDRDTGEVVESGEFDPSETQTPDPDRTPSKVYVDDGFERWVQP